MFITYSQWRTQEFFKGGVMDIAKKVWGPGARSRASVGSRGKAPGGGPGAKPLEAPGVYSMFNAKYSLNLRYFNTFLSCFDKLKWQDWLSFPVLVNNQVRYFLRICSQEILEQVYRKLLT